MKLILVSHGNLAKGMKNTLEMIVGKKANVIAIAAYDEEKKDFASIIEDEVKCNPDQQIVILTDVLGGSVNNDLSKLVIKYSNVFLVTGMNLSLVLTLITYTGTLDVQKMVEFVAEGKKGIVFMNEAIKEASEEDSL